eukprot:2651801-Pyramimonas_sp.AAC.1
MRAADGAPRASLSSGLPPRSLINRGPNWAPGVQFLIGRRTANRWSGPREMASKTTQETAQRTAHPQKQAGPWTARAQGPPAKEPPS